MTPATLPCSLDEVFAEYLLRREAEPQLLPATWASTLPESLRSAFLAEVEALQEIDRLAAAGPERRPAAIGPYRLLGCLGRGAAGVVYEAEQVALRRRVAVKVLHEGAQRDDQTLPRFRREARMLSMLHHPSIVAVHEFTEHEGRPMLVMQLAPGNSLRVLLEARGDPTHVDHALAANVLGDPLRIVRTFARIAEAVACAHARGIVHRDLKPANILVDEDGHPTLVDFGLAQTADDPDRLTRVGDVLGTPLYMAPEQLAGKHVGPAADVWALGCVLQECLTGQPAAGPDAGSWRAVPAVLRKVIARCREQDPRRRLASAHELATMLHGLGRQRHLRRRPSLRALAIRVGAAIVAAGALAAL